MPTQLTVSDTRDSPSDASDTDPGDEAGDRSDDAPPATPHEYLASDPDLAPVVEAYGPVELEPAADLFERLLISICRQQVSMDAAAAIRERLFDACEVTPAGMLSVEEATLREAGLSQQKIRYVYSVAEAFEEHGYTHEYFARMDEEAVVEELTAITGVGRWTANMVLMFGLGRPDVFPVGDLGIRKGMHRIVDPDLTRAEMATHAERWAPYRSYASLYLWRAIEG